jgi:perosamine synthetase
VSKTETIPVNEPDLTGNEARYVHDAVSSGWISSGEYVRKFEEGFARFVGTRYGVSTTSGTAALQLALASLGLGPGDEVIVPALTIVATVFAVCYTGATPVLVDSEPDTGNLDPGLIERRINRKTRAIVPVHLYGHPAEMDPILELGRRYHLRVVEDAAEAHGAEYRGRRAGSLGDINCFSFYANKIITTGEGGMITTDDEVLAGRVRHLKDLCHAPERRFLHTDVGYTLRMTNMQAAVGVAQLERAETFLDKKKWMAETYAQELRGIEGLELPVERPHVRNVFWMYALRVTPEFGGTRDELMRGLKVRGIDTRSFFIPMHQQPVFHRMGLFSSECYPIAEQMSESGLYLPSGLTLTRTQIERVAGAIREVQAELRAR